MVAAVVLGLLALLFAADSLRLRAELSRVRAEREALAKQEEELSQQAAATAARAETIARDLASLRSEKDRVSAELGRAAAAQGRAASLDLGADRARTDGPIPAVRAGAEIEMIRLLVPLRDGETAGARALIRSASGARMWDGSGTATASGRVSLLIPARLLPPGDYVVSVAPAGVAKGGEEYAFRVHR